MTQKSFTTKDLSLRWKISPRTLARWLKRGVGPPCFRVGRTIRYRLEDIEAFEQNEVIVMQESVGLAR